MGNEDSLRLGISMTVKCSMHQPNHFFRHLIYFKMPHKFCYYYYFFYFQVDFGDIGPLLKIRIEIDGSGTAPDCFLNFVEFKDLDTEERFFVMCGKWLRWISEKSGSQRFRELPASGFEPLPCESSNPIE